MSSIAIPAWLAARNPKSFANPTTLTRDADATWEEIRAAVRDHHGPIFRVKDCVGVQTSKTKILAMLKEARESGRATVWGKQAGGKAFALQADVRGWPTVVWLHLAEKRPRPSKRKRRA